MAPDPGQGRASEIAALRDRQPQAVERWFREYADAVYAFAFYRVGKDPDLATEVVQETFMTALKRIEEYDPERGVMLAWLTCGCRNSIRKVLREKRRSETLADAWDDIDQRLMERLSAANIGNHLAIVVDGKVVHVAAIRSKIGAAVEITGSMTPKEVNRVVVTLRAASRRRPATQAATTRMAPQSP